MPQLTSNTPVVSRFTLPSSSADDPAWVDLDTRPLVAGDSLEADGASKPVEIGADIITSRIHAWNYTEADGSITPISRVSVLRLELEDFKFIRDQLGKAVAVAPLPVDEKKS